MFNWIAKEEGADAADPEKAGAMAPEPMGPPAGAGRWHRADGTGADGTRADGTGARRRRPEADSYDICPQFTNFPYFGLKVFCAVPIGRAQTR
jgi:hypothetical protein